MKKLHIAQSPLSNRVYCGHISKDNRTWLSNKTDVTGEACAAVAKHVLHNNAPVIITENGAKKFKITVEELIDHEI